MGYYDVDWADNFDDRKSTSAEVECSISFRPDLIGGSELDPGCSVTTISLYQNHLSKTRGSDFNLGQAHKHLHLTKCIYNEGIPYLFKLIYKIDFQSSNCFYKISMFKNNGVNAYVGAYSAILSL